jgi:hypothetical protein
MSDIGNMIVTNAEGERIVLIDNTDARREDLINTVLQAFKDMGTSDEKLEGERCRLDHDPDYFIEWVVCLPKWHDSGMLMEKNNNKLK